ncbi:uncharacterized protein LOC144703849 [Wolffia australiana]
MAVPGGSSVLETIFEDGEYVDYDGILVNDVDMLDAEEIEESDHQSRPPEIEGIEGDEAIRGRDDPQRGLGMKDSGKKRKKFKKRKKRAPQDARVTDINKFVIETCRHLRERKSYLVWNAVGCLGIPALKDLVKEVDAVQSCGGQKTTDGKRYRTGGGILWNILKVRDPKAYKEIMAKGREFERQFKPVVPKEARGTKEVISPGVPCEAQGSVEQDLAVNFQGPDQRQGSVAQELDSEVTENQPPTLKNERPSILSRIRKPVAYDDLFE